MITESQVRAALPSSGFLRGYVDYASQVVDANIGYHVVAGLCLLTQTVPTEYYFPGAPKLRANLYGLLVGPSSVARKTRSMGIAESLLADALPDSELSEPGSPEALVDSLEPHPQILFYNEFGSFLKSTERGQLSALRMRLADVYDCRKQARMLVERQGRRRKAAEPNPRLSVLAGSTVGLLEAYTTEVDWQEGFLARFLTIYATGERKLPRLKKDQRKKLEWERERLVQMLRGYKEAKGSSSLFTSAHVGQCEGLTDGAESLWDDWGERNFKRVRKAPAAVQSAVDRAEAHALKIALALAWDVGKAREDSFEVDEDTLSCAISLAELHVQSVIEIASGLATDRDGRDERALLRAFTDADEPRGFGEAIRAAGLPYRRGKDALASLVAKGFVAQMYSAVPDLQRGPLYQTVPTGDVIAFSPMS